MSAPLAAPPAVSADPGPLRQLRVLGARVGAMCLVELQKLRRDQTELLTRAIQPALWLLIFGETFTRMRAIPTGSTPYLDYLAPGILAQSALFISIFYGIQIIWERDAGVLAKLLVTPTPRAALVAGKAFAAGVRALVQALMVLVLAAILGVGTDREPAEAARDGRGPGARVGVLLLPVHRDRRAGAVPRTADGHRAGDHHAAVLRLERALPGRPDAAVAQGAEPRQPVELSGGRACAGC